MPCKEKKCKGRKNQSEFPFISRMLKFYDKEFNSRDPQSSSTCVCVSERSMKRAGASSRNLFIGSLVLSRRDVPAYDPQKYEPKRELRGGYRAHPPRDRARARVYAPGTIFLQSLSPILPTPRRQTDLFLSGTRVRFGSLPTRKTIPTRICPVSSPSTHLREIYTRCTLYVHKAIYEECAF